MMKRLTALGRAMGFNVRTKIGEFPKVYWKFIFEDGTPGKIKLEINTYERSPMLPLTMRGHSIVSSFYEGSASVPTFQPEELVATKLRALYLRKKGRDLYDLWLALTVLKLDPKDIISSFPAYKPDGVDGFMIMKNLDSKLESRDFCTDVNAMLKVGAPEYNPQKAGKIVSEKLLSLID